MSIIKEKILNVGEDVSIKFSLGSRDGFTGYQQEIDNLTQLTSNRLINPAIDVETRKFKMSPDTPITKFNFGFYNGSSYGATYHYAGFTSHADQTSSAKQNSFYILDFYDTFDQYTQRKIFTTYLTKLTSSSVSVYTVSSITSNQFYYWYVPQYYISEQSSNIITGYVKLSFYNAKLGKTTLFYNNVNNSMSTAQRLYFTAQLNLANKTWKILNIASSTVYAKQVILSTAYVDRVNNTYDKMDNLKQNPPTGNTYNYQTNTYLTT